MEVPKKTKIRIRVLSRYMPRSGVAGSYSNSNSKRYMHPSALFIIAKTWKQPKCPSIDEWIKKMWHIYIHTQWNTTQQ